MKTYEVSLRLTVANKIDDFETDETTIEELVKTGLYEGRDGIIEKLEEVSAREMHEEEEEEPEGPTIEVGDKVTSSIAEEKYAIKGELTVVGFDGVETGLGTDESLIVVMTEDREEIRLRRDELDTVIKGDETFDL